MHGYVTSSLMGVCIPTVWRKEELERINSTTSGAERKAALCSLLEKEAELIAGIGQHRTAAGTAACEKAVEKFLDAVSDLFSCNLFSKFSCCLQVPQYLTRFLWSGSSFLPC